MNVEPYIDRSLPYIKKWFFSFFMLIPTWVVVEQFWMAIRQNILFAVNYPYPFFIWPLMFILDNLTLIIHEAGHTIFGFFGWRFLGILGGTLMQLLIPFMILISAWLKEQRILAQFSLFWLGFSWMDSAAYCADAYLTRLPLIGNLPRSAHDFLNMLSQLHILDKYLIIAWIMYGIGFLILILGLIWPLFRKKEYDFVNLSNQLEKSGLD